MFKFSLFELITYCNIHYFLFDLITYCNIHYFLFELITYCNMFNYVELNDVDFAVYIISFYIPSI